MKTEGLPISLPGEENRGLTKKGKHLIENRLRTSFKSSFETKQDVALRIIWVINYINQNKNAVNSAALQHCCFATLIIIISK